MLFTELPSDILFEILRHLLHDTADSRLTVTEWCQRWCLLSSINRQFSALCRQDAQFALLQKAVVSANQQQVVQLLAIHPAWLFRQAPIRDFSGRFFPLLSPWQYAAWALDITLLRAMLRGLVEVKHRMLAYQQLVQLFDQATPHDSHYDFVSIVASLRILALQYDTVSQPVKLAWWIRIVGELQRTLPVHVAQEYCRLDRAFYPPPLFEDVELPRCVNFFVRSEAAYLTWYRAEGPEPRLGRDFAIGRGGWIAPAHLPGVAAEEYGATAYTDVPSRFVLSADSKALLALWSKRLTQVHFLSEELANSLQPAAASPAL